MIKINLLPVEKRKAERTPLPRLGLILTNVVVLGLVLVVVVWLFISAKHREDQIASLDNDIEKLKPDEARFEKLKAESGNLEAQVTNLRLVTGRRPFPWWQVFDSVWDVVQQNPKVWLDSIEVLEGKTVDQKLKSADPKYKGGASYGVLLKCHSGGLDVKNFTDFRMALKGHKTLSALFPQINFQTEWKVSDQKEFLEQFSLDYEVILVNMGEKAAAAAPGVRP